MTKAWKQPKYPSSGEWLHELWNKHAVEYYLAFGEKMRHSTDMEPSQRYSVK